jgi:YVTN family beta-propeller protein
VWVSNFGSATITRIDPATNDVIATIDGGFGPEAVAFNDEFVWVANGRDGTVSKIDPESNTVAETIDTGAGSEGLLVDALGNVLIAVTNENRFVVIPKSCCGLGLGSETGNQPRRMVFAEGGLWVTNTGDGTVSVFGEYPIPE